MATTFQESKYDIQDSRHHCASCEQEVECEAQYYSAIFYLTDHFERRDYCELCWPKKADPEPTSPAEPSEGDAPEGVTAPAPSGPPYAFWKARRPPLPTEKRKRLHFDVDLVLQFFRSLCQGPTDDPAGADGQPHVEAPSDADGQNPVAKASAEQPADVAQTVPCGEEKDELAFVIGLLLIRKKTLILGSTAERDDGEWLQVVERKEPKTTFWIKNPNLGSTKLERVKVRLGELLQMQI